MNDLFRDSQKDNSVCAIVTIYQQMVQKIKSIEINWNNEKHLILLETINMLKSVQVA